jgi:hypothetical protein
MPLGELYRLRYGVKRTLDAQDIAAGDMGVTFGCPGKSHVSMP